MRSVYRDFCPYRVTGRFYLSGGVAPFGVTAFRAVWAYWLAGNGALAGLPATLALLAYRETGA